MVNNYTLPIYVSTSELGKMLGISRVAVFKRIKKGLIPAQKVGRAYAIPKEYADSLFGKSGQKLLTEDEKSEISAAVKKAVTEYGETLKLLGKE